jgi:fatty-acyl-CoA synthase
MSYLLKGTTGSPKGATLSHHNLVNNASFIAKKFMEGIETEVPVICCQVPLYHAFGCVGGSLMSAIKRGTIVFPSEAFNPKESLEAIQEYK